MLTMTAEAAEAVKTLVNAQEAPEGSGLRFVAQADDEANLSLEVSLAPAPAEGDSVVESSGARVFLEPTASSFLDDKTLDAQKDADGNVNLAVSAQA